MDQQILSLLKKHHVLTEGQLFQHLGLDGTDADNNIELLDALGKLFTDGDIEIVKDITNTMDIYRIKRELQ